MAPVSPFGVPQTLSAAFFGGLWGIAYAAAEPWLAARLGWLAGGLAFGILPLVVLWFVVFPLKGIPVGGGFTAFGLQQGVVLHVAFGLGLAIFFQIARYLDEGRSAEHTSELQSLISISYAVFCLKKKKNHIQIRTQT